MNGFNFNTHISIILTRLRSHLLPITILVLASCAVYIQAISHEFIINLDDQAYVTGNEMIRGVSADHLKRSFAHIYFGNYAPLHLVSYMIDYEIWGLRPAGFILTNIILHTINGLFYYILVHKFCGKRLLAFLTAFIFLLHPVQVESVAWISERKNLLAMTFFLLALLSYTSYRETGWEKGKVKYAVSLAAFLCALLSKSVAVVLPLVLLIYELCCEKRSGRWSNLVGIIPFAILAGIFSIITMTTQSPAFTGGGRTSFHGGSPLATFFTMLPVMTTYLGMLFWPSHLSVMYNPPIKVGIDLSVIFAALILAGCCLGGIFLYRRRKDLFFWGALYFIALIPVSQIVPIVTLMNDRYLYFPMLGWAAFLVLACAPYAERLPRPAKRSITAVITLVYLTLAVFAFKQVAVWQNSVTLWSNAISKVPDSKPICYFLVGAFTQSGRMKTVADCIYIGQVFERGGLNDDAYTVYASALSIDPTNRDAIFNLSRILLESGEFREAESHLKHLVQIHPNFPEGYAALAYCSVIAGKKDESEVLMQKAVQLGYDGRHIIVQNPLRDSPEFKHLITKYLKN